MYIYRISLVVTSLILAFSFFKLKAKFAVVVIVKFTVSVFIVMF